MTTGKEPIKSSETERIKLIGIIEGDFILIYDHPHEIHEKTRLHKSFKGQNHYTHPNNVWYVGFPAHALTRYKAVLASVGFDLTVVNKDLVLCPV